jgi:carbonic anhydrase/acetyltransferase-like protein (isoleucine patch superfamily)
MPIYALGDLVPVLDPTAYVHPDAVVVGDVHLGPYASVWPGAVLRGDHGPIDVGAYVAVQDGTVVHGNAVGATRVGDGCVIGHLAHLEGCRVGSGCLIGSGSIVMPRAEVGDGAVVAAGAVVRRGMAVPAGAAALGVPARIEPGVSRPATFPDAVRRHAELADRYRHELRLLDSEQAGHLPLDRH